MSNVIPARDFTIYIDDPSDDPDGGLVALGCAQEASLTLTTAEETIECKDTAAAGWTERVMGLHDYSMSASGFVKRANPINLPELAALQVARARILVRFSTETSGDTYFEGYGYISEQSYTAGTSGGTTYDVSIVGDGALTIDTIT